MLPENIETNRYTHNFYGRSVTISREDLERDGWELTESGLPVPKTHPFRLSVWLRNSYAVAFVWWCRVRLFVPFTWH